MCPADKSEVVFGRIYYITSITLHYSSLTWQCSKHECRVAAVMVVGVYIRTTSKQKLTHLGVSFEGSLLEWCHATLKAMRYVSIMKTRVDKISSSIHVNYSLHTSSKQSTLTSGSLSNCLTSSNLPDKITMNMSIIINNLFQDNHMQA